jgi:hypothetical protein
MIQKRVTVGRTAVEKPDDLDILSAIWILSCNDEDGVMTYRGTAYRLGIDESAARRIVRSRTELFRPGVPQFWLDEWKESIKSRSWLPSWYIAISDPQERAVALENIKTNDTFRNQFRPNRGSEICDINVIDWGLEHIDRLRKANYEARDENMKRWTTIITPSLAIILAILSMFGSVYTQVQTSKSQFEVARYQTDRKPKQDAYSGFMGALYPTFNAAAKHKRDELLSHIARIEGAYYLVDPFLSDEERNWLWNSYQDFVNFCFDVFNNSILDQHDAQINDVLINEYTSRSSVIRSRLHILLFRT